MYRNKISTKYLKHSINYAKQLAHTSNSPLINHLLLINYEKYQHVYLMLKSKFRDKKVTCLSKSLKFQLLYDYRWTEDLFNKNLSEVQHTLVRCIHRNCCCREITFYVF